MSHKHELGIVAIVQNQAFYLPEWVRYHRAIGVEKFYLYDNDSADSTMSVARALGCEIVRWPGRHMQQLMAHRHAVQFIRNQCRWLAFIDPDEFIYAPNQDFLKLLYERRRAPALAMCWACFGTSGIQTRPDSALRSFVRRATWDDPINLHIKSVIQPALVTPLPPKDPHHFLGVETVDFEGRRVLGPFHSSAHWQPVRLNHYISRSITEAKIKMVLPRVNNNETYSIDLCGSTFNQVKDNSMVLWAGALGV